MSKVKPTSKVKLDKERNLVLDLNAMVAYEDAVGESLFTAESLAHLSARQVRALLWACLLRDDPDITQEKVGEFITPKNFALVQKALEVAIGEAASEPKGGEEAAAPLASESPQTG